MDISKFDLAAIGAVQAAIGSDIAEAVAEFRHNGELQAQAKEASDALRADKSGTLTKRIREIAGKAVAAGLNTEYAATMLYQAMVAVAPLDDKGKPVTGTAKGFTNAFKGWCAMTRDALEDDSIKPEAATMADAQAYVASPEVKELKAIRARISTAQKAFAKDKARLLSLADAAEKLAEEARAEKEAKEAQKAQRAVNE